MTKQDNPDEIKPSIFKDLTTAFKLNRLEKVHKEEIRSITTINENGGQEESVKYVTTSIDGFIKMIEGGVGSAADNGTIGPIKKAFFVCQSGINDATQLSSPDSFAVMDCTY